jgi:N-acetylglucosamine-6-phosphate deacetylase
LPEGSFERADLLLEGARIARVAPSIDPPEGASVTDLEGLTLAPGFIDVHVHGGGGFSLITTDPGEIADYARWAPGHGVTAFLPTICAGDIEPALRCAAAVAQAMGGNAAEVLGVNLEGPFVSPERRGALPPKWPQRPDPKLLARFLEAAPVRVMSIAPELPGALGLLRKAVAAGVRVSVGHTDAPFDVAREAFEAGALHLTHAFNAMRPLHQREPGPLAAALDRDEVTVEVIADGVHLHPATVRLLVRAFGPERVCLVTDAVPPAGLPDGEFQLGGQEAHMENGVMRLSDGTIAGGTGTMEELVHNVVRWRAASPADALRMASAVPARVAGVAGRKGAIAPGFDADLVALTEDLAVARTWTRGRPSFDRT